MKHQINPISAECVEIIRTLIERKIFKKAELERILGLKTGQIAQYLTGVCRPRYENAATMLPKLRQFTESGKPVTDSGDGVVVVSQNGEVVGIKINKSPMREAIFGLAEKLQKVMDEINVKQAEYERRGEELIGLHETASRIEATIKNLRELSEGA